MSERSKWVVVLLIGLALGVGAGLAAAKHWPAKHNIEGKS